MSEEIFDKFARKNLIEYLVETSSVSRKQRGNGNFCILVKIYNLGVYRIFLLLKVNTEPKSNLGTLPVFPINNYVFNATGCGSI